MQKLEETQRDLEVEQKKRAEAEQKFDNMQRMFLCAKLPGAKVSGHGGDAFSSTAVPSGKRRRFTYCPATMKTMAQSAFNRQSRCVTFYFFDRSYD